MISTLIAFRKPFLIILLLTPFNLHLYSQDYAGLVKFDSTKNFLFTMAEGYIGQKLIVLGSNKPFKNFRRKCIEDSYRSKKSNIYAFDGKNNTIIDSIKNRKFIVNNVKKTNYSRGKACLELQDSETKELLYFNYDGDKNSYFPFVVEGFLIKVKTKFNKKKYILDSRVLESKFDQNTGNPISLIDNEKWECRDVVIENNPPYSAHTKKIETWSTFKGDHLSLTLVNSKNEVVLVPLHVFTENLGNLKELYKEVESFEGIVGIKPSKDETEDGIIKVPAYSKVCIQGTKNEISSFDKSRVEVVGITNRVFAGTRIIDPTYILKDQNGIVGEINMKSDKHIKMEKRRQIEEWYHEKLIETHNLANKEDQLLIEQTLTTIPNNFGGVGVGVMFRFFDKSRDIKYLEFEIEALNAVNDKVNCTIRNSATFKSKVTGPIMNLSKTQTIFAKNAWYNKTVKRTKLIGVIITYLDGTMKRYSGNQVEKLLANNFRENYLR